MGMFDDIDKNDLAASFDVLRETGIAPEAGCWVCQMKRLSRIGYEPTPYFYVLTRTKPAGQINLMNLGVPIAAGSYDVVYGPCSKADADAYLDDVGA